MRTTHRQKIQSAYTSRPVNILVRVGYSIRGLLYGLIGFFCITLALGLNPNALGTTDVLTKISTFWFGSFLLVITITGLLGYSLWSLMRAFMDFFILNSKKLKLVERIGYLFSAGSYTILVIPAIALLTHSPKSTDSTSTNISKLFDIPFGYLIVITIGLLTIAGGFFQVIKAIKSQKPKDLWSQESSNHFRIPFMIAAKIGISMRGIIYILIGYFFIVAGTTIRPSEIKNIQGVLDSIHYVPGGFYILMAIGIGLLFFGIYSATLSLWVDLPE